MEEQDLSNPYAKSSLQRDIIVNTMLARYAISLFTALEIFKMGFIMVWRDVTRCFFNN